MTEQDFDSKASQPSQPPLSRPLVFVGLMGAGKSAIGKRVAAALDAPFYDSDKELEAAASRSVSEIFADFGEEAFRDAERKVIARLLEQPSMVLATGGGAFMNTQTRALIKERAVSVWLKADLGTLVKRTGRKNTRPLLQNGDPRKILAGLMRERHPVYAKADLTVRSVDGPHERTVKAVLKKVRAHTPRAADKDASKGPPS